MFFVVVFVVCLFFPPKLSVLNRCSPRWQPQERKERDGVESKLWSCCVDVSSVWYSIRSGGLSQTDDEDYST